jgi:predicted GNAT superfamily acetyltransferase
MEISTGPRKVVETAAVEVRPAEIEVRELAGIEDMQSLEDLQATIWGSDPAWVVPAHLLYILAQYGGIVLGARVDGELIGFVFGLLARRNGHLLHASHMLGIRPSYQGHGIGSTLKQRQRECALEQGLDRMMWTFDPLESRNGYFNFHKLMTTSTTYRADYYGPMRDALNQGLPSDRLVVEWDLGGTRKALRATQPALPILMDLADLPELRLGGVPSDRPLAIQVPADIQALRRHDSKAALLWRMAVREAFTWAFSRGYIAGDFDDGAHILFPSEGPVR